MPQQDKEEASPGSYEHYARPSIAIKMIRHAESRNNQVYSDARRMFRMGTNDCDLSGWTKYVDEHRRADPTLSEHGYEQATMLADYLVPLLRDRAAVTDILCSPMRRTLETIRPTVQNLQPLGCRITVNGFYFETEGCHTNGIAEEGMNPAQIETILFPTKEDTEDSYITSVGFPDDPSRGWWTNDGSETRAQAEERAAKFYLWLCEHLDEQLADREHPGIFDGGVAAHAGRQRKTQLLIGHGDFMSLVLKRVIAGFGHAVETPGIPHQSAFVHWNTGITELEYFGQGRFLVMSQNSTPHLSTRPDLLTGGSLKDGWSFLMPHDLDDSRLDVVFSDQELDESMTEQKEALKSLFLRSHSTMDITTDPDYSIEESDDGVIHHFVAKRGLQVVAVAAYSESTGRIFDVAVRPSASKNATDKLFATIKDHSNRHGRSGSLLVKPRTKERKQMFESFGFCDADEESHMEFKH